jgi:hypothetical protein
MAFRPSTSAASVLRVSRVAAIRLYTLQLCGSPADPQDMTRNDEPIYETVKSEHNWDPERGEPLGSYTPSVGRHRG